jgi:hypothetical protein
MVWSDSDKIEDVYINRTKQLGIARVFGRYSKFRGKSRRLFNQCVTGTLSISTTHWLLKWGIEHA